MRDSPESNSRPRRGPERLRHRLAASRSQDALGGGDAAGGVDADGVAEAAGEALERRLDDVVHVAAGLLRHVQGEAGVGGERGHGVLGQLRVEGRVAERQRLGQLDVPGHERAARDVEGDLDERLVERVQPAGEAADAGLVAERLAERLAEGDGDVLDGVVGVDVQVAGRRAR